MAEKSKAKSEDTQPAPQAPQAPRAKLATGTPPPDELYVDGVLGVMARNGVFKIDCYRFAGIDRQDGAEVRRLSHRLVLPAGSIPELLDALQQVMQRARQQAEAESAQAGG